MRLPHFTIALGGVIVGVVMFGTVGGLDTVEIATASVLILAALVVWFLRQPRQPRVGRGR